MWARCCLCGPRPPVATAALTPLTHAPHHVRRQCACPLHCTRPLLQPKGTGSDDISNKSGGALASSTTTDDRTVDLLRNIARHGGRGVSRPRSPSSSLSSSSQLAHDGSAAAAGKAKSPLARLFASLPPTPSGPPANTNGRAAARVATKPASAARGQMERPPSSGTYLGKKAGTAPTSSSGRHSTGSSSSSTPMSAPPPPPSRALLEKLLVTIREEKRVPWEAVVRASPEVEKMPLYACRDAWIAQMRDACSATPLPPAPAVVTTRSPPLSVAPLLLCAAPTGTGKSVLLPLFALDAHWSALEARLQRTLAVYGSAVAGDPSLSPCTQMRGDEATSAMPFALSSQAAFVADFTSCSRLCIVVSQPTRVACAELARYTSAVLSLYQQAQGSTSTGHAAARDALTGKRVGFAVGGERRFCAETEIIYATPGYLVNAFQHKAARGNVGSAASARTPVVAPTTLMVDEAHCRDIETDALLAWMQLSRGHVLRHSRPLRQYCVMSATMSLSAMDAYLSHPPQFAALEDSGGDEDVQQDMKRVSRVGAAPPPPPLLLLSPGQQQRVERWWQPHRTHSAPSSPGWAAEMQRDAELRRCVLQVLELGEGEAYSPGDGVNPSTSHQRVEWAEEGSEGHVHTLKRSTTALRTAEGEEAEAELPQGIVAAITPHRVERFFMDDLDPSSGCFAQSHVLFDATTRRNVMNSNNSSSDSGASSATSPSWHVRSLPLCLAPEGATLRQHLCHTFGNRLANYHLFGTQSRLVASFALHMLQAVRLRWGATTPATAAATADEHDDAPATVLLFLPGVAEMYQVAQSLERVCERVVQPQKQPFATREGAHAWHVRDAPLSATPVDVFRSGSEVFSVGYLHSSAIGSPQEQLTATARTGAPLRLLLTTNVAESSLTIPNAYVVIDSCLERRVRVDTVTGTTRVQTAFVAPGGLRQRCGRVGRTGEGVVIHMAPRRFVLPPAESVNMEPPTRHPSVASSPQADMCVEPLADGALTVLLHMKYLFLSDVAAALAALPSPPSAQDLRIALQQLVDMQMLLLPIDAAEVAPDTETATTTAAAAGVTREDVHTLKQNAPLPASPSPPPLDVLLNASTFTAKGLLVAALPLPAEHAALVYHGLQFLCVEDAVLAACAMAVPSLFTTPRVTAYSTMRSTSRAGSSSDFTWSHGATEMKAALSPLEAFYEQLAVQRGLAGFDAPGSVADGSYAGNGEGAGECVGHLSEPLALLTLLRRWYALSTSADTGAFLRTLCVNRGALRQVDTMVEQCCSRLLQLMVQTRLQGEPRGGCGETAEESVGRSAVVEGVERDLGYYVCSVEENPPDAAAPARVTLPFLEEWSPGLKEQLMRSLRRLQRAAHARVHLRPSAARQRSGLPQWHDDEERRIRLCSQPFLHTSPKSRSRRRAHNTMERRTTQRYEAGGELDAEETEQQKERAAVQRAILRHPSFAHWCSATPTQQQQQQQQQPYPSLTTPPPLRVGFVRARSPAYRPPPPPPPPPPLPPVAFLLGRYSDRLCAAFVAAFGHRTMRGEDGSHRFHHRRLVRNQQALEQDAENVCTVHIDVQAVRSRGGDAGLTSNGGSEEGRAAAGKEDAVHTSLSSSVSAPTPAGPLSYEMLKAAGLTPRVVHDALSPYLAGAGLLQLEMFQSNRLALALRFAARGFPALGWTEKEREVGGGDVHDVSGANPGSIASGVGTQRVCVEDDEEGEEGDIDSAQDRRDVAANRTAANAVSSLPGLSSALSPPAGTRKGEMVDDGADLLRPLPLSVLRPHPLAQTATTPPQQQRQHEPSVASTAHPCSPFVQLAPFGVSLLVAAAAGGAGLGGLHRIPLPTANTPTPTAQEPMTSPAVVPEAVDTRPSAAATTVPRGLHFASAVSTEASRTSASVGPLAPVSVSWMDNAGTGRRILQQVDAVALGWSDLFPTPAPAATHEGTPRAREDSAVSEPARVAERHDLPNTAQLSALTLSVIPPVYLARSITWKVPLPCVVHLPSGPSRNPSAVTAAAGTAAPPPSLHYCVLCQRLCSSPFTFAQHCRSPGHLEHLYQAVRVGLSRTRLEQLYGYPTAAPTSLPQQAVHNRGSEKRSTTHALKEQGSRQHRARASSSPSGAREAMATAAMPLLSLFSLGANAAHHREAVPTSTTAAAVASPRLLTQQLHPCVVHTQSFLNCLQWTPRRSSSPQSMSTSVQHAALCTSSSYAVGEDEKEEEADRATPLAVAGGLVSMSAAVDVLPPPHHLRLRTSTTATAAAAAAVDGRVMRGHVPLPSSTLSAHHVWVLDVSSNAPARRSAAPSPPPMSLLFVLAGYLAAASPQAMVALLHNAAHTHLYGVMVYGLGAWKLPQPLPMEAYAGVLEHVARGGGWTGLLIPIERGETSPQQQQQQQQTATQRSADVYEGLHWCAPSRTCATCTRAAAATHQQHADSADDTVASSTATAWSSDVPPQWSMVEATLLLVLHEYLQARRNMVTLAGYVERVLHKLQCAPLVTSAADLLAHYITDVRGGQGIQSILRDVGCVFVTPPHALTALLNSDSKEESSSSSSSSNGGTSTWSRRLSTRALSVEGAAVEVMFTVPPVLPSVIPPPDFAAQLRRFYSARQTERWHSTAAATAAAAAATASTTAFPAARVPKDDVCADRGAARPLGERGSWDDRLLF